MDNVLGMDLIVF